MLNSLHNVLMLTYADKSVAQQYEINDNRVKLARLV